MPMDDYHASPALSATRLKAAANLTPRQYWRRHLDPTRPAFVPSDAMRQGSLVDCLLTSPGRFETTYAVMPAGLNRTTKAGKEAYAELQASGKEIISADWLAIAQAIAGALQADPVIGPLLKHASQSPHFWEDEQLGPCRYLPDIEAPGLLLDLKKTAAPDPRGFAVQCWNLGYDIQLAHYAAGHLDRFGGALGQVGFIAYDWSDCPDFGLYWLPADWLLIGHQRRAEAAARIRTYEATPTVPGTSYGSATLELPRWATIGNRSTSEEF